MKTYIFTILLFILHHHYCLNRKKINLYKEEWKVNINKYLIARHKSKLSKLTKKNIHPNELGLVILWKKNGSKKNVSREIFKMVKSFSYSCGKLKSFLENLCVWLENFVVVSGVISDLT